MRSRRIQEDGRVGDVSMSDIERACPKCGLVYLPFKKVETKDSINLHYNCTNNCDTMWIAGYVLRVVEVVR